MIVNYDEIGYSFIAKVLDENSRRLSRTRGGASDTTVSIEKRPLLLHGEELRLRSAENERVAQQFVFRSRWLPTPRNGKDVLSVLWQIEAITNGGLLPTSSRLRTWRATRGSAENPILLVDPEQLPAAIDRFSDVIQNRWGELQSDPVPLASWAECNRSHPGMILSGS